MGSVDINGSALGFDLFETLSGEGFGSLVSLRVPVHAAVDGWLDLVRQDIGFGYMIARIAASGGAEDPNHWVTINDAAEDVTLPDGPGVANYRWLHFLFGSPLSGNRCVYRLAEPDDPSDPWPDWEAGEDVEGWPGEFERLRLFAIGTPTIGRVGKILIKRSQTADLEAWLDEWRDETRTNAIAHADGVRWFNDCQDAAELGTNQAPEHAQNLGNATVSGSPVFVEDSPLWPEDGTHALIAADLTATPVLGEPALAQSYALAADGLTASPALGIPAVGQRQDLEAVGLSSSPLLGVPVLNRGTLAFSGRTYRAASVSTPHYSAEVNAPAYLAAVSAPRYVATLQE